MLEAIGAIIGAILLGLAVLFGVEYLITDVNLPLCSDSGISICVSDNTNEGQQAVEEVGNVLDEAFEEESETPVPDPTATVTNLPATTAVAATDPNWGTVNGMARRQSGKCELMSTGEPIWSSCDLPFSAGEAVYAWRITDSSGNLVFDGAQHGGGRPTYIENVTYNGTCYDCAVNPWPGEINT
jgi:hypothetical protein